MIDENVFRRCRSWCYVLKSTLCVSQLAVRKFFLFGYGHFVVVRIQLWIEETFHLVNTRPDTESVQRCKTVPYYNCIDAYCISQMLELLQKKVHKSQCFDDLQRASMERSLKVSSFLPKWTKNAIHSPSIFCRVVVSYKIVITSSLGASIISIAIRVEYSSTSVLLYSVPLSHNECWLAS